METPVHSVFLTAHWQNLAMINYEIDPHILKPHVPRGVELDFYQNQCLVSLVGFQFLKTRIKGFPIPFHCNFEEINLRFYVRRKIGEAWRRGVVFIKEIVPRQAIAWVARRFYHENYIALPIRHSIQLNTIPYSVRYSWKLQGNWNFFEVIPQASAQALVSGSIEEFITEHYWGYSAQDDGGTVEYQVEHPSWRIWQAGESKLDIDIAQLYGQEFVGPLSQTPHSALLAEGSPVVVYHGNRIN